MLTVKVLPKKYELISSWLLRLTNKNGININVLSEFLFNNSKLTLNDIDKSLESKDINQLAKYIDIDSKIIERLTLKNFLSSFSKEPLDSLKKWKWIIPSGAKYTIKTNGLQFCSKCLQEKNTIFYVFNRLSWNIICPIHNKIFQNNCSKCNHQFSPNLKNFNDTFHICSYCNHNLTLDILNEDIYYESLELQTFLNNCIKENQIVKSNYNLLDKNLFELLYSIRTILNFTLSIQKNERIINLIKEEFELDNKSFFKNKATLYFDILESEKRMKLMKITSKFLKMDIKLLENFLMISKVTYKQFLGLNTAIPESSTIKYLSKNLKIKETFQSKKTKHKKIQPKSKEEVDMLMYELEEFLE
ncbi:TniQ family protein [Aliarcobacter butzleri]